MKAIAYTKSLPITDAQSLFDLELPQPVASGQDLLVKVKAIAVNPVDYKVRLNMPPAEGEHKVLGWDAVGEVVATGEDVSQFKVGDVVYYAGDLTRAGSNAEYQLVDQRIVGHKPKTLSDAEAAALPLTAITAWEILFEHLAIKKQAAGTNEKSKEVILVVGAAGGVGSILIQIAKAITGATIIATASRPSSKEWVQQLGADYVVDHSKPLPAQIAALNIGAVTHVASLNGTGNYFESYTELLAPFGKIAMIDDPQNIDISKLKMKSLSLHWEFMFARSMFNADDMIEQSRLLNQVSELIDQNHIKTTLGKNLGAINASNLKAAHQELESGRSIGKIVLEGF
ncbi:zinc-binding alcohol dehydrogenase family protein [Dasania sp. GY-MA-18]|uniref:Zinc-type alcohol dehydrogenase-like protein n=1 Tax=Dasania phycosphaerae TaxID=2950436 RepID=A0A9J6RQF0_9GAMM|nr:MULTISPECIES: zinc-binding alcohol dehydrogenase family protein [Dasania]MCR8923835.1 zinc-binding alcohol dehydrogenase family protein [Dasania sp. GY-MA-18]MCZ0866269.1 zinc-binding alcohol dehydrogenase family protein [Dasania phycosphaerae]MCZ0869993.1 zinc-binding alcohol dehydrogenase family protein [Dasania phycosphaerae]